MEMSKFGVSVLLGDCELQFQEMSKYSVSKCTLG